LTRSIGDEEIEKFHDSKKRQEKSTSA